MDLWRKLQKESFHNLADLADFLELDRDKREALLPRKHFPLLVPMRLARKMEKNSLEDPLLLQFVPLVQEKTTSPGFCQDPVHDKDFQKTPNLLHKYAGRVLLVVTGACAMHCRYCFRQNFPYSGEKFLEKELAYIENDPSIHEVILSGGDPLSLADASLFSLLEALDKIPHLQLIRFHTRFPIGIPERLSPSFLSHLSRLKKQMLFVIHSNHPKELDEDLFASLKEVQKLGIPLLCQTVLLKGVNDREEVLYDLFLTLSARGILPYYLHLLDKVEGSAHFSVDKGVGLRLMEALRARLPGYALPLFVQEVPHALSKTPITSC